MIASAGLVVNDSDKTSRAGTEGVLGSGIGNTASGYWRDVACGIVRATFYLIERAAEGAVQGASGAVCCDAGRAAGRVDVARPSGDRGAHGNEA